MGRSDGSVALSKRDMPREIAVAGRRGARWILSLPGAKPRSATSPPSDAGGLRLVLILDDAHHLRPEVLGGVIESDLWRERCPSS